MATTNKDFETFVSICREAIAQQGSGRTEAFQSLWSRDAGVVLIGAAGSHQKGWHDVSERLSWASQHLNFGGFHIENLLTSVSGDLAFTVDLEHMSREVDGKTEQRTLRSSQGNLRPIEAVMGASRDGVPSYESGTMGTVFCEPNP